MSYYRSFTVRWKLLVRVLLKCASTVSEKDWSRNNASLTKKHLCLHKNIFKALDLFLMWQTLLNFLSMQCVCCLKLLWRQLYTTCAQYKLQLMVVVQLMSVLPLHLWPCLSTNLTYDHCCLDVSMWSCW